MAKITGIETFDVRFPTSKMLDGSDAMNQDPDYSGAYLRINTDAGVHGDSLVFTIGRGNEVQIKALDILGEKIVGLNTADALENIGDIARELSGDSQLRWLGPDYGVFHMGAGGVLNALWDLFAKERKVPLWKLLSDLSPQQIVNAIDFRYITDALNKQQALDILNRQVDYKADNEAKLRAIGVPAYTTSPGWLGYTDEKMLKLTQEAMDQGFKLLKYKCGKSLEDDKRRLRLAREAVGPNIKISIDANQVWDVNQAIEWIKGIGDVNLHWVEEPTNPDDVLGHAAIAKAIAPVRVATGEHGMNRIIFKQMLQAKSFSFMQIDATRVAGVNENLANILMAAKFGVPVCPHAGGVGLCELVQHLAMFDAVAVSGHHSERVVEFVDHLHEHFVVPTNIQNAHYMPPSEPGAGGEMYAQSIADFTFPTGKEWVNA